MLPKKMHHLLLLLKIKPLANLDLLDILGQKESYSARFGINIVDVFCISLKTGEYAKFVISNSLLLVIF